MTNSLASYAVSEQSDRERRFPEKPHRYRTAFERDRDRIIHCEAFRRLEGKTQVFSPGRNDNFRTRLTHCLEVAQVGRTIARVLRLNESLTEAVCLAHDLGHSPFGHAGESVLNELMARFGCFEHNRQTLRIVDILENPYPDFPGLNLMYQTRLGLAKHHSTYDKPDEPEFTEANCSLEGQAAGIADRIAYNCHDLEDGLRARIIHDEQLCNIAIFEKARAFIGADAISDYFVRRTRTAKAVLDILVSDCIETSQRTIESAGVSRPADVLSVAEPMVRLSVAVDGDLAQLEKFLMDNMYRHPEMEQTALNVRTWISDVFGRLCAKPELMPRYYQKLIEVHGLQRTVCDYIAGMTDRYCLRLLKDI